MLHVNKLIWGLKNIFPCMRCFGCYCKGIELGMSISNFTDKRYLLTNYYMLTSKISGKQQQETEMQKEK